MSAHVFSNATPHLWFFKNFKIGKKHQRRQFAWMGLTNFSKSRKTQGARRQSGQQLNWLPIETASFILTFSLRAVRSYSMDRRDFPFPYYDHKIPRSEQYSFLQELGNHMWSRDWRLQFHLMNCDRISSILFQFLVWCNLIFQPIFSRQHKNWSAMRPGPNLQ